MMVGLDGKPFQWGIIAVWVCGAMEYFHRKLIPDWAAQHEKIVAAFFAEVEAGREPDPIGSAAEIPVLKAAYPAAIRKDLDLRDRGDGMAWAQTAREYAWHTEQARFHKSAADTFRGRLMGLAGDHDK